MFGPRVQHALPPTSWLMYWIARLGLFLLRFDVRGEFPAEGKLVVIAAPHTSNWDGIVGLAAKYVVRANVVLLGKRELFWFPLGSLLRLMGVVPVDRHHPHGVVGYAVELLDAADSVAIGLAPEGTRFLRDQWRSGFYHIAVGAGVPITCVRLDYRQRAVVIAGTVRPTGDVARDMDAIRALYDGVEARHPAAQSPIRLAEEAPRGR